MRCRPRCAAVSRRPRARGRRTSSTREQDHFMKGESDDRPEFADRRAARCPGDGRGRSAQRELAALSASAARPRRGPRLRVLAADGLVRVARVLYGAPALHCAHAARAACRRTWGARPGRRRSGATSLAVARVAVALASAGHRVGGRARAAGMGASCGAAAGERRGRMGSRRIGRAAPPRPGCLVTALPGRDRGRADREGAGAARGDRARLGSLRVVAGVVYYATPAAMRAVERAIGEERRQGRGGLESGRGRFACTSSDPKRAA